MAKTYNVQNYVYKGLPIMTKVKNTDYCRQNATKGVTHKLQKAKPVQAKVNLLIQSCWPPACHKPVSKKKTVRRQSLQISPWVEI